MDNIYCRKNYQRKKYEFRKAWLSSLKEILDLKKKRKEIQRVSRI